MNLTIYSLTDPRDARIYYVGATTNPEHIKMYLMPAMKGRPAQWFAELRHLKIKPVFTCLEVCAYQGGNSCKEFWVSELIRRGEPLLNNQPRKARCLNAREEIVPDATD